MSDTLNPLLTKKDFLSDIAPRWCPGCGDNIVFQKFTGILPQLGIRRENFALISGIGCSSRFPYYVNTYGFHTIHGRAPTIAMGLKLSRPELSVWVITGDGDGLAIGGNHFMHLVRRNADIKVLLFNNQIYGLTKGQTSPTTAIGTRTKTAPKGADEKPMNPLALAIASGATFAARVHDLDGDMISEVLLAAGKHKGVAVIEILTHCLIFNDSAFNGYLDKAVRAERTLNLKQGEPILYGAERNKCIRMKNLKPVCENVDDSTDSILVHDARNPDSTSAYLLSQLEAPEAPVPFGIFRQVEQPVYMAKPSKNTSDDDFAKLMRGNHNYWRVLDDGSIQSVLKD